MAIEGARKLHSPISPRFLLCPPPVHISPKTAVSPLPLPLPTGSLTVSRLGGNLVLPAGPSAPSTPRTAVTCRLSVPRGSDTGETGTMDTESSDRSPNPSEGSVLRTENLSYWTTRRDGEVRLRRGRVSSDQQAPLTVHDMVMHSATRYGNYIALGTKRRNQWHLLTYIQYYELCRRAAKGFLKLGLRRFHTVGILGLNSQEWVIASIGAIMAGGICVSILPTTSSKAYQVIARSSEINVLVVDSSKQLQKISQVQSSLRHLRAIVQYKEAIETQQPNLYSWQKFLDLGGHISDERLDSIIDAQKPNQCCALVYSLVATGPPKIIMLSHDNITWTTAATVQSLGYKHPPRGQEVLVSYLPLSYASAQILDMWVAIAVGGTLYFSPQDAEKLGDIPHPPGAGYLTDLLREVRPTTFLATPWMWDRMMDGLRTSQLASTVLRQRIDAWAMDVGLRTNKKRMFGELHSSLNFRLAKKLTFRRARKLLGLGHCERFLSTGVGLSRATLDFFLSLDIPIYELYGPSECTGVHSLATGQDFRLLSCGKGLPSTRTKVVEEDEEGIGSINIWGRHVFMGYLGDQEATVKKTDGYGWLHSGDLGFLDVDDFLYIKGNSGDIITLSSGRMVNPNPIEERVKEHIPLVRGVLVVGQDAPHLCALLTLKCQVNWETGVPRKALTSEAVALCRRLGSQATRLEDIVHNNDPVIAEFIRKGMEAVNAEAPSESARVVQWAVLDTDFSVGGGELGVTSRLKRATILKMYQAEIESFYKD
ncbi:long-chain-fatty-acid--CoA ligase ACSBG2-like isoform X2 [Cavia porcellus]|uniref:long-chain-fatty-acid--CoA ligase n=1 Tax=Cavia porcellus TaxID=10141 RepID=H0W1N1_CAVPO|nr:long-chain-fatty-acid--CoA ligase ACSBG2-like [Cavia porcellus]